MQAPIVATRVAATPLRVALVALLLVALTVFGTPNAASAAPAVQSTSVSAANYAVPAIAVGPRPAVSSSCGGGRCTIWFNKADTKRFAEGYVGPPPVANIYLAAFWIVVQTHRLIAKSYAAKNWCSAFNLSIWPWERQGYFGYRC